MTTRNQRITLLALTALVGLTRFIPLSRGPWDWDEILFCIAVGDYNVAAHQPHPAGFPLFILLGKIARLFADSDFHALQAVNVAASLFVFPAMYAAARAFRLEFLPSIGAALIFSFLTNIWFYGGTAFSDVPGMVLFLGAIAAYLSAGTDARRYRLASILLAAGILVRPQNAIVALFPWTMATVRLLRARRFRSVAVGSLIVIALAGIGYGIAAYDSGVGKYVMSLRSHSHYVTLADSVINPVRPSMWEVTLTYLDPFEAGNVAWLINILALIAIAAGRRHVTAEVLLTFVPYVVFSMLAANPAGSSRFSVNYLAGMVILAVEGTNVLSRWMGRLDAAVPLIVAILIVGRLIQWGLPAFDTPRNTFAPPTAAALWVRDHVPLHETVFVHGSMNPWMRYLAPRHRQVIVGSTDEVLQHPAVARGWYVSAGPGPAAGAIAFVRPRNRTWNIVTKRGFEAFVQPTDEILDFGEGWHGVENDGTSTWRWSSRRAVLRFGPSGRERALRLRFHVPVHEHRRPVLVTMSLNGQPVKTIAAQADNDVTIVLRGRADRVNEVALEMSEVVVPAHRGGGDRRELGLMLTDWGWQRGDRGR